MVWRSVIFGVHVAFFAKTSVLLSIILIFSSFCCKVTVAQNVTINGRVKDQETALQSATISIAGKNLLSNSNGEFSVSLKAGAYTLVITHVGYRIFEQTIILNEGEVRSLEINLIRADQLGEVRVLGSRSFIQRSNLNTSVPVDILSAGTLKMTGQPSLIQMLNFTAPSFNTSRQHLSDPVTLRGLSPDHLLILVNGIRYHNMAGMNSGSIRGTLGRGAVSNDLNSIPFSSIEKIEILRDGASAQYGSDAIAGVMNIVLKKTQEKTTIDLHLGQHYKGDGENILFGLHHGIHLAKKGFLNFSGDFRYRNDTHRGGEYLGTVYFNNVAQDNQRIVERGFNRKTPVSNDGSIRLRSGGLLINGGYDINKATQLFWTASANYRHPVSAGAYRFPKNQSQVNIALHPDGFKNINIIDTWDLSAIAGARGKAKKEWNWEWSSAWGKNSGIFHWKNTNNASQFFTLGAKAPTEFYGGKTHFTQLTNTINFSKDLANKITGVKTFNLSFGGEFRYEIFQTRQGEEAAWENYDTTGQTQGGAQPSPGISKNDVVDENRKIGAVYIDLETDITDRFLMNISGRLENYDDFGNNLSGKLAARYKISPALSIRGSINNGFHAPALQQIYYSAILSGFKNVGGINVPARLFIFRNNHDVNIAFGVKQLKPEKAINIGSGLAFTLSRHISLTVDAYWIQIKNRMVLSGIFDKSNNPDVYNILQNRTDIDQVQFMTNAINTKTRGIDMVFIGSWNIRRSNIGVTLAANFTRTHLFGAIQIPEKLPANNPQNTNALFNREEEEKMERGQPRSKIILQWSYKKQNLELLVRNTRFGKTSTVFNSAVDSLDESFSAKILTDVSVSYTLKKLLVITLGANNILDIYPDPLKKLSNKNQGILIYSNEAMPFGYNGGYYYVSMNFRL